MTSAAGGASRNPSARRDLSYIAINRALRTLHREHIDTIKARLIDAGAAMVQDPMSGLLTINDELTAALIVSRCREIREGEYRWLLRFDTSLDPDITVAARRKDCSAARSCVLFNS